MAMHNWIPSSNKSIVTKMQAALLEKISTGMPFNLGQTIFNIVHEIARQAHLSLPFSISYLSTLE